VYRNLLRFLTVLIVSAVCSLTIFGQASSLSGAVVDPTDDVIPGANVMIKNMTTGAEFKATTAGNGTFSIPALDPGTYTVTITAPGFKQSVIRDVKVEASVPASVRVSLEVGNASESVVVQGGGEIVQTQSATVSTTLNVNQVMSLPLVSRNAVNFIVFLPGVDTPGLNRDATINGLPENAINITIDGINAQDNFNKTTDGNFARVSPRLDAVQEVTVTTAASGAGDSGSGGAQIKFVTRQGSNELHGSVYEYHRNPVLNSNYWFSNRDNAPVHSETGLTCGTTGQPFEPGKCRAERARVLTNQYGFRVGGPITIPKIFNGRDRAFFFVNYEEFRLPNASNEQRTIFNPLAQSGTFQYNRTVNGQTVVERVDLLALAARNGQTSTIDPTIGKLLADIRSSTSQGQVTQLADPNLQRFNFTTPGNNVTYFPTVRLDFNLTEKHHLEATWNYQKLYSTPDFLNNRDPSYPGFPNSGSQIGDRFTGSVALRSTLSSTIVNEVRGGMSGGPSRFNPEASAETFSGSLANQGGFTFGSATGTGGLFDAAGINNPSSTTAPSRRNPLLKNISDTMTWTRGAHSFSFGGEFSQYDLTLHSRPLLAPNLSFGVNSNDPAIAMFTTGNFPGAANADLTRAQGIYAVLTGRITAITANALLDEKTNKYVYLGESVNRGRQRQYGIFAQDSWRMRPNLTVNYGLRWEVQGPFSPTNSGYTTVTVDDLFGVSGPGNIFKPGVQTGRVTQFIEFKPGDKAYNVDYSNFAPNFGFAWTPNVRDGLLSRILGGSGRTVIRGGYAIAYNRNGLGDFSGTFGANPGSSINASRSYTIGNLGGGTNGPLPVLLRETSRLGPPAFASSPVYPLTEVVTGDANIFDPNIKVPYAQSWTFGIQRELSRDMAIEVRYVGTRNLRGWTEYNLNDVENNMIENGLLNEFKLAQRNLEIFRTANPLCGTSGQPACNFGFRGLPGQSPLPITLAYFAATRLDPNVAGSYGSTLFSNNTFVNTLAFNNPAPGTYADNLHTDAGRRTNALNNGLAKNFFLTNPDLRGGVFFTGNGGYTRYDALQVEFRRRLSQGLLIQSNYAFAKGFESSRVSFRTGRINALNGGTPGYVAHSFKLNWVYEVPVGRGKALFGGAGPVLDRVIGGWEFHGTGRVQTGQIVDFGNVNLVGMTRKDLQKAFKIRIDDAAGIVYHLPQDIIDNTIKAFSVSATSATGYGSLGAPSGRYIAPANSRSCIQVFSGECAPQNTFVQGPMFTRFDMSAVKRVKITERVNFELRGEFLNAFNNINFLATTNLTNRNNALFGQVTTAYTDSSNTQDPGGRLIQIVARINF
jgi:hypothetical protein